MSRYIRKPQEVNAIQWNGFNINNIIEFFKNSDLTYSYIEYKVFDDEDEENILSVRTGECQYRSAYVSDYFVIDKYGMVSVLKQDKFIELYEPIVEESETIVF